MCGICGEITLSGGEAPLVSTVQAMNRAMHHRGPDGQGEYADEHVAIGSTRLAIIDLAGGQQPVHNEDQTVWIVFNGEIYNSPALRRQLERLGHAFYTRSDTEVIVHAYEEFGEECVRHLNGIFAFAIWDTRTRTLFVARDRIGVKPLFYTRTSRSLIFASELKVLLAHPLVDRKLDLVSLDQYLTFEYVPAPRSILKGVKKLPPGHTLTVQDGRVDVHQYWDVRLERSETGRHTIAEYELGLVRQLQAAVQKELLSDVEVGVLLSGGIDSSALAVAAARASSKRLKTFTAIFEDSSFDESRYASLVARRVGSDHHQVAITTDAMLDVVPKLGGLVDEPLGDSSFVPTYLLSQFTRRHVKVALGGDGGDELFAGYPTYQAHRLIEYYERLVPASMRWHMMPKVIDRIPTSFENVSLDFKLKRFIGGRGLPVGVRHHQWLGSFTRAQKDLLLQPWARVQEHDTFDVVYEHQRRCIATDPVNQLLYWDMKMYLEGDILQKVDRASMACSLEVRVPLLNHTFVEWATSVPHDLKLKGLTTKYLFRKALRRVLPPEITDRKKKGFNMPVAKWLAGPLRDLVEEMLSERRLREDGFFEPAVVRSLLDEHAARRADHRKLIWTLLVFQLWHEALRSGRPVDLPAPTRIALPDAPAPH